MSKPHILSADSCQPTAIRVMAWIKCIKCNNALHLVMPGKKTPYWLCQDGERELEAGQEIEVEYIELNE